MYSLLVGFAPDRAYRGRVFEYTEPSERGYLAAPDGSIELAKLATLPAIVAPEVGSDEPQVARVGRVSDLRWIAGGDLYFRFTPNPRVPAFPTALLQAAAPDLHIGDWELQRTHWSVKPVDVYGVLDDRLSINRAASRAINVPVHLPQEQDLVAVMMPFSPTLNAVYESVGRAASSLGMRCARADDIWDHAHIIDDVLSLIWRAQVVIADLSGRNTNVFYETGIAHALGKEVLQISQSMSDVPFDLQAIRTLVYLNNGEGLAHLERSLAEKLLNIQQRATP